MRYSSLASADRTEFHTPEVHPSFGLTRFQYNINKVSKAEIGIGYSAYYSGFGGLEVACWPLVPKFVGS